MATSDGGGIEAFAPSTSCDDITLTNDTITGNTAINGGGYYGTGCVTTPTVTTALKFDTISGNTATNTASAGNIQTASGDMSNLTLADSIVANGSDSGGAAGTASSTGAGRSLRGRQPHRHHELRHARDRRHHRPGPPARRAREQRGTDPDRGAGDYQPRRRGDPLWGLQRYRREHR